MRILDKDTKFGLFSLKEKINILNFAEVKEILSEVCKFKNEEKFQATNVRRNPAFSGCVFVNIRHGR